MKDNTLRMALALLASAQLASAQGTAFMFHGRLNDGGTPATGLYDLELSLWNNAAGPNQIGGTVTVADQPVTNGLFAVPLRLWSRCV